MSNTKIRIAYLRNESSGPRQIEQNKHGGRMSVHENLFLPFEGGAAILLESILVHCMDLATFHILRLKLTQMTLLSKLQLFPKFGIT